MTTGFAAIPADFTTAAPATPEEFTAKKENKDKKPLIRPSQS